MEQENEHLGETVSDWLSPSICDHHLSDFHETQ
jgi:hypothetical protein